MSDPPKPMSLRERIAAFEKQSQAQSQSSAAPPPPPASSSRGKVSWKPRQRTPSPPRNEPDNSIDTTASTASADVGGVVKSSASSGMSASDAREAVRAAGGSLKERMAALQGRGGFGGGGGDAGGTTPPAPVVGTGRRWVPPPKPAPEPEAEGDVDGAKAEQEGERGDTVAAEIRVTPEGGDTEKAGLKSDDLGAGDADVDESERDPEELERERRAAIAARMSRLGGSRVGMVPPVFGAPRPVGAKKASSDQVQKVQDDDQKGSEEDTKKEEIEDAQTRKEEGSRKPEVKEQEVPEVETVEGSVPDSEVKQVETATEPTTQTDPIDTKEQELRRHESASTPPTLPAPQDVLPSSPTLSSTRAPPTDNGVPSQTPPELPASASVPAPVAVQIPSPSPKPAPMAMPLPAAPKRAAPPRKKRAPSPMPPPLVDEADKADPVDKDDVAEIVKEESADGKNAEPSLGEVAAVPEKQETLAEDVSHAPAHSAEPVTEKSEDKSPVPSMLFAPAAISIADTPEVDADAAVGDVEELGVVDVPVLSDSDTVPAAEVEVEAEGADELRDEEVQRSPDVKTTVSQILDVPEIPALTPQPEAESIQADEQVIPAAVHNQPDAMERKKIEHSVEEPSGIAPQEADRDEDEYKDAVEEVSAPPQALSESAKHPAPKLPEVPPPASIEEPMAQTSLVSPVSLASDHVSSSIPAVDEHVTTATVEPAPPSPVASSPVASALQVSPVVSVPAVAAETVVAPKDEHIAPAEDLHVHSDVTSPAVEHVQAQVPVDEGAGASGESDQVQQSVPKADQPAENAEDEPEEDEEAARKRRVMERMAKMGGFNPFAARPVPGARKESQEEREPARDEEKAEERERGVDEEQEEEDEAARKRRVMEKMAKMGGFNPFAARAVQSVEHSDNEQGRAVEDEQTEGVRRESVYTFMKEEGRSHSLTATPSLFDVLPAPVDGAETHSKAGNSAAYLPREMPSGTFYCISYLTRCPAFFPLFFVFRLSLRAGWAAPVVSPRLIRTFWWFFEERFSACTMPASCGNGGCSQAARISRKVLAVAAAMLVLVGGQSANAVKIGIRSNNTSSDLATPDVRARDVLTPQMSVNTSSVPATCLETCAPIFETEKTCGTNLTCLCTDPAVHSFALCIDCVVGTAPSTLAQSAGQGVISGTFIPPHAASQIR
ncbi:unnamed protein product [Mycena citricolor]|uniref:Uncharacterized protein n=1 Tax=Mycena citricolor TaxID=2018698 RepID=A0AAD2K0T6_9AGAR|nr:unnamed protein product [Mycena citricolor]